jgi:hypothetical protein
VTEKYTFLVGENDAADKELRYLARLVKEE